MNNEKSPFEQAYEKTVNKLAEDMPLLLHGSGDVPPSEVSPDTCQLLAALTAQYIANLVDAALDAQEMLCDGAGAVAVAAAAKRTKRHHHHERSNLQNRAIVPPPSFPHSRKPPIPPPVPPTASGSSEKEQQQGNKKRKIIRREKDEFWDEPLPKPKIRNEKSTDATTTTTTGTTATNSTTNKNDVVVDEDNGGGPGSAMEEKKVPADEWVGAVGVDLFEASRARSAYVRGPSALTTQNFIFPICHDVYAYGRVLEAQKLKRQTQPLLMDPVVMEMVRTEGRQHQMHRHHRHHKKMQQDRKKGGKSATAPGGGGGVSDPEDEDEDDDDDNESEGDDGPMWPGLEYILPVHRS